MRVREIASRRGLRISEYGVFDEATGARVAGATEEEVYATVGLPWIPPELRENQGEIEAAREGRLPALVTAADLRGDLHAHTDWSDGHHSLERLVAAAEARGYEYVIVSDHSRSLTIAGGLDRGRAARADRRHPRAPAALPHPHPGRQRVRHPGRRHASTSPTRCWPSSTSCWRRCTPASSSRAPR